MYSKTNVLAAAGLLATGAMGQSSSFSFSLPSSFPTSLPSSLPSLTLPTTIPVISIPTLPVITSFPVTADPSSTTPAMGNMHKNGNITTPVWSYYSVDVTSVTVVHELTTVCVDATTLTFNDCTYPATAGQVVTVTNCPCTITTAVPTWTSSLCYPDTTKPAPPPAEVTHAAPAPPVTPTHSVSVSVEKPSHTATTPPAVQVAGANGNTASFALAAVAVVLGFF